jgi:nucleoside-diphosphate-sugar epimerase
MQVHQPDPAYYINMKILLTGVTGYIGKRLLPVLVKKGHTVVCCVQAYAFPHTDLIWN